MLVVQVVISNQDEDEEEEEDMELLGDEEHINSSTSLNCWHFTKKEKEESYTFFSATHHISGF